MWHSLLFRQLKRPLIRLSSRTVPPDGASGLSSRPNVVPDQVFETNINFLHQLEKDLRKTFKRKWKFPSDDKTEENRNKGWFQDYSLSHKKYNWRNIKKRLKWNLNSWTNVCFFIWIIWPRSDLNFKKRTVVFVWPWKIPLKKIRMEQIYIIAFVSETDPNSGKISYRIFISKSKMKESIIKPVNISCGFEIITSKTKRCSKV